MKSIGQSWQSAKGMDGANSPRRGKASVMKPSTNGMRAYVAPRRLPGSRRPSANRKASTHSRRTGDRAARPHSPPTRSPRTATGQVLRGSARVERTAR